MASGFWPAFMSAVEPEADKLVTVHPLQVKAIASARLKNDRVDSEMLAHLSRAEVSENAVLRSVRPHAVNLRDDAGRLQQRV